jgi:hypothetical protein
MPGDIWWGDVIRAQHALGVRTTAEFAAIAEALGYRTSDRHVPIPRPTDAAFPAQPPEPPVTQGHPGRESWQGSAGDEDAGDRANLPLLQPVAREPIGSVMLKQGDVLARTPVADGRMGGSRRWPLLPPRSSAAILQYLLSRSVPDGAADIATVLTMIAAGRPVNELPREQTRTLRFGAQILVDHGESMRPFRRDQADVVSDVRAVVGASMTNVAYFADVPSRGAGPGRRWSWQPYEPPISGTRVLLLTDFGIGADPLATHRASPAEWARVLRLLLHQDCRPVALVPYPPQRWPRQLRRLCPMVTWDRHTTVGHARTVMP